MGSSGKYPHALNKWQGTDQPLMEDFNHDNKTLDEKAMWKAEYDEDGTVLAKGGVSKYVDGAITTAAGSLSVGGAAKLMEKRAISLIGEVTGTVDFDGSADVFMSTTSLMTGRLRTKDAPNGMALRTFERTITTDPAGDSSIGLTVNDGYLVHVACVWPDLTTQSLVYFWPYIYGNTYRVRAVNRGAAAWLSKTIVIRGTYFSYV